MNQQTRAPFPADKNVRLPVSEEVTKEVKREEAEVKEVDGRHKNDGQLNNRGRQ